MTQHRAARRRIPEPAADPDPKRTLRLRYFALGDIEDALKAAELAAASTEHMPPSARLDVLRARALLEAALEGQKEIVGLH